MQPCHMVTRRPCLLPTNWFPISQCFNCMACFYYTWFYYIGIDCSNVVITAINAQQRLPLNFDRTLFCIRLVVDVHKLQWAFNISWTACAFSVFFAVGLFCVFWKESNTICCLYIWFVWTAVWLGSKILRTRCIAPHPTRIAHYVCKLDHVACASFIWSFMLLFISAFYAFGRRILFIMIRVLVV